MIDDTDIGLSILVPVFNECATIRGVLERVRAVAFPVITEIVVVDDGSTDGTTDVLRKLQDGERIRVLFHRANQGKGSAIRTALGHARGRIVVVQDADDELDPADLLPMFNLVSRGETAVCYGSRFSHCGGRFYWQPTYWANRFLTAACNVLNGLKLTDMNTCYKMMRMNVADQLEVISRGFAMEVEITTKLARMGISIIEHPISYFPRTRAEGKKIRLWDLVSYFWAMIRFRFSPRHASISPPGQTRHSKDDPGALVLQE